MDHPERLDQLPPIDELHGVDRQVFEQQVVPQARPVVLRGLVASWPLVQQARQSPEALCQALLALDSGVPVDAVMVPPGCAGRLFYSDDHQGFNFLRRPLTLTQTIEHLVRYSHFAQPPSVAVQSAPLSTCAPGFAGAHAQPLLPTTVAPRLWLGNAITTPAHFDESHNIACVVAGQRRFTLWPPEQIGNLYPGPPLHAPTGTPISLADLQAPDFQRFPRLRQAFAAAQSTVLAPGDALYIPPLWWHHVVSMSALNALVNYWWRAPDDGPAMDLLLTAMRTLGRQSAAQRRAWAAVLGHFVLDAAADPQGHWPEALRQAAARALQPPAG